MSGPYPRDDQDDASSRSNRVPRGVARIGQAAVLAMRAALETLAGVFERFRA